MENSSTSSLQTSRELSDSLEQTPLRREPHQRWRPHCPQIGKSLSKGAVLVIVWTYLFTAAVASGNTIPRDIHLTTTISFGVTVLLSPLAGLTASVCFSRYKVLLGGLWCMWTGSVCTVVITVLQSFLPETSQHILEYSLILAVVPYYLTGFVLLWVNVIPFGLDQMPDASSEQIKAFIRWFVWAVCAGIVTGEVMDGVRHCAHLRDLHISTILSLFSATLVSLILCSNYLQKGWLVIEPVSRNPLRTVYLTVRFAVRHKHPVRRSAFTYCEDKQPSRLDLAKSKYGGPFTTEEVEDVKTCLRMTVVICCLLFTIVPGTTLLSSMDRFFDTEFVRIETSICHKHLLSNSFWIGLLVLLCPAMHMMLTSSLFRKWIHGILKGICITQTLALVIGLILLLCSTIWYLKYTSAECMFNYEEVSPFPVNTYVLQLPLYFLFVLFFFFTLVGLLEFVCAQAPYAQKGLLLGLAYSVLIVSYGLGELIYNGWNTGYKRADSTSASCGVWFYLFVTITAVLVCVMWCFLAKWYKKRERDEPDRTREYVEDYYNRYCSLDSP